MTRGLADGTPAPVTVVVVDDHPLARTAVSRALSGRGIVVVGVAADGEAALRLTRDLHPDVVVMDIRMPGLDGIQAARAIRQAGGPAVVLVSSFDEADYEVAAHAVGASFLSKSSRPTHWRRRWPMQLEGTRAARPSSRAAGRP